MAPSYSDIQITIVAVIYVLAGSYALLFGISSIQNKKANDLGLGQFGLALAQRIYGKSKVAKKAKELQDPNRLRRLGVLFVFLGIAFIGGGIVLIFEIFH